MAKRTKIELGTPTEDLPEWSVSLNFSEVDYSEDENVTNTAATPTQTVQPSTNTVASSGSALDSGFAAEFVLDGAISSQEQKASEEFDDDFDMFGNSNTTLVGGDYGTRIPPIPQKQTSNVGGGTETDAILGGGTSDFGANENTDAILGGGTSDFGANENMDAVLGGILVLVPLRIQILYLANQLLLHL